jgi:nicotinamide-nucleotide amidase
LFSILGSTGTVLENGHMRVVIINTGDELLRGALADTNAVYMASRLYDLGFRAERLTTIGDDLRVLTEAFAAAFCEFDLVLVSGGLGPTDDDLTAAAAAAATGVKLVRSAEAEKVVRARFARCGWEMHAVNLKQADVPEGCRVLDNPNGTAPGFALAAGRAQAFFMPGPPRELEPMFEADVVPWLPAPPERHVAVFRLYGMGESNVQAALAPYAVAHPELVFGYRATFPEIGLRIAAKDEIGLASAVAEARRALGAAIFAEEEVGLPEALGRALASRGLTIAAAESCTGGLIGHELTQIPGSSAYFRGAIVAYDNTVKSSLLGVDARLIEAKGAVSEEVVRAMADGARRALGADLAIAVSGIAGPDGGTADKPVGLVHFAVATARDCAHLERMFRGWDRAMIKAAAAWTAMRMALDAVREIS